MTFVMKRPCFSSELLKYINTNFGGISGRNMWLISQAIPLVIVICGGVRIWADATHSERDIIAKTAKSFYATF